MFKKLACISVALIGILNADSKDNWFMEIGWQTSLQYNTGSYDSFNQTNNIGIHVDGEYTEDMMHFKVGKSFEIEKEKLYFEPAIGTTFALLDRSYYNNAFFIELPLLLKTDLFDIPVKVGPKVKYLYHYDHYWLEEDEDYLIKKAEFDEHSAWAFGIKAIWGEGDWEFVTGIEYLNSADYSAYTTYEDGWYAKSEVDSNGIYLSIALRHNF
ncbi:MAG: hypothetical protein PHU11_01040 [Dysgonamonadaceae bacterium]|nr:hypothetical protein [Sulfurovum sp.]MDD3494465.1 hypothetical protein [Dysgonamonadaceae bacterium]